MKNTIIDSNLHTPAETPAKPWRRARATACATLAALLLTSLAAYAGNTDACVATARYVYTADLDSAHADFAIVVAKANDLPTEAERKAVRKQAVADLRDVQDEAKARFRARRDLCGNLGESRYNPVIDPADFLAPEQIPTNLNRLYPLVPGTTFTYRSVEPTGTEIVTIKVTHETRVILGVTCIVVRDTARVDGAIIEDTVDWFAQDRAGNVWYFGENTAEYHGGLIVSIDGGWEAGVNGAKPGIVMFAQPTVGKVYRQELSYGEAEDAAKVLALDETVTLPSGNFTGCLKTEDFTPIEPDRVEHKYYAPGIGNVLTVNPGTGKRSELISAVKE